MTPSKHYYSKKKKEAGVLLKHLWTDYDDDDDDDDVDDVDDVDGDEDEDEDKNEDDDEDDAGYPDFTATSEICTLLHRDCWFGTMQFPSTCSAFDGQVSKLFD